VNITVGPVDSIRVGPVDSIRGSVRVKFLNKTGADHNGKSDRIDEYCNPSECEDVIRCDLFFCVVYIVLL
jgi:hypothetical protein